jgi:hypothetical protein
MLKKVEISQNTANYTFVVNRFGISFSGSSSLQITTAVQGRKMSASGFEGTLAETFLRFLLLIRHLQIVANKFASESPNAGTRSEPANPSLAQAFDGYGRDPALVLDVLRLDCGSSSSSVFPQPADSSAFRCPVIVRAVSGSGTG